MTDAANVGQQMDGILEPITFRYHSREPMTGKNINHILVAKTKAMIDFGDGTKFPTTVGGQIHWSKKSGKIAWIEVPEAARHLGIGTALVNEAHRLSEEKGFVAPKHSNVRTDAGEGFVQAIDSDAKPRTIRGEV